MLLFQNYHQPAYAAIQAVSLEHTPSLFVIQISFQNHQMAVHQAKTHINSLEKSKHIILKVFISMD